MIRVKISESLYNLNNPYIHPVYHRPKCSYWKRQNAKHNQSDNINYPITNAKLGRPTTGISYCLRYERCWERLSVLLISEIGDVRRFHSGSALVAYAGLDAPLYQSGTFDAATIFPNESRLS